MFELLASFGFSIHDVIGPLVGGLGGWAAAVHIARSNEKIAEKRREGEREVKKIAHEDDLTQRFRTLMDGYESRIRDLTAEVQILRKRLEEVLAARPDCLSCDRVTHASDET
jgi:hypothetical protein